MSSGHSAHDAHAHEGHPPVPGSPAGIGAHTSLELPPAPAVREISPARGDYAQPWPGRLLFWPIVWAVIGIGFYAAARRVTGPIRQHEGAAGEHGSAAPTEHRAPAAERGAGPATHAR